ncbi:MAG: shikimate dehydrogenase [Spirochaetia bacterium]|nr:shikimate dehydrogenase [Spirochaetia bacterium]
MICLTLTEKNMENNLLQYQKYEDLVDVIELRVDMLEGEIPIDTIVRFPVLVEKPVILSCRKEKDGGKFSQGERTRLTLLRKIVKGKFSYIELEEDMGRNELETIIKQNGIEIIRSFYDFTGVPGNIFKRMQKISQQGEIPKAAVTPKSFADTARIFEGETELKNIEKKILLGMGDFGVPTRILYKRTGSLFGFCSAPGSTRGVPGYLTPELMKNLYKADTISHKTAIYGIIGNPVMHTASPAIHNPGFHKLGIDAVYIPFLVDSVRSFFAFSEKIGIKGFSVTIPHKQNVLPYLGVISNEVKQIGSCNTVVQTKKLWKGINTDYYGFLHPIQEDLETGTIKKALVIGAGGAARSVVWALRNYGCSVYIVNRTFETAARLAARTGSAAVPKSELALLSLKDSQNKPDLVVQTTSVGMEPTVGQDPSEEYIFNGDEIVYDLIYKPRRTRFINRASQAGCRIVYGYEMLYAQGLLQFKTFTGKEYPQN